MDALISQAIRDTTVLRKTSVPWNLDEACSQPYYDYDPATSSWVSKSPSTDAGPDYKDYLAIDSISLYTWNIDFILPFAEARMKPALAHLEQLTRALPPTVAPVIFLQECTPSDLKTIAATSWVQEHFHLTDIDHTNWATTQYGTAMLVSASLPMASCFRVHYFNTRMDRDALFVDVSFTREKSVLRLCNTHLESMAFDPPYRPAQMKLVAQYMRGDGVHAAVAAGDFNAIQPFDRTLHTDNNLKDAFLELGGKEDTAEGHTWGQQASTKQRTQFGCSRMDKVFFRGSVKLKKFRRFGMDILAEGDEERRQIMGLGFEKPWVTDHLGVMVEIEVVPSAKGQH